MYINVHRYNWYSSIPDAYINKIQYVCIRIRCIYVCVHRNTSYMLYILKWSLLCPGLWPSKDQLWWTCSNANANWWKRKRRRGTKNGCAVERCRNFWVICRCISCVYIYIQSHICHIIYSRYNAGWETLQCCFLMEDFPRQNALISQMDALMDRQSLWLVTEKLPCIVYTYGTMVGILVITK